MCFRQNMRMVVPLLNPDSTPMLPWGALFSALIVLGLTRGWAGIKSLLADMFRWRVGARWYAFAFLVPIGINVATVYLNAALGAPAPPASAFFALDPMLIGSVMSKSGQTAPSGHIDVKAPNLKLLDANLLDAVMRLLRAKLVITATYCSG